MAKKRTENSLTESVAQVLTDEGLDVETWPSISGPDIKKKIRDEPEFLIKIDGKKIYGEAKWDEENKYRRGFTEATKYLENIRDADGSFLIGYPKSLRSDIRQTSLGNEGDKDKLRDFSYRAAALSGEGETSFEDDIKLREFAEWLKKNFADEESVQDISEILEIMESTVEKLKGELDTSKDADLFRNVIGGTPDENGSDIAAAAQDGAAYLLLNQISFYRVLAQSSDKYNSIRTESLDSPADLQDKYFDRVLEDDYRPVFGPQVAVDFSEDSLDVLKETITIVRGISLEKLDRTVLGKVFHRLIPLELRKKVAAYYTLNEAAHLLSNLSIDDPDASVIDPACGSGTLLVGAYQRKKKLLESEREFAEYDHKRYVSEELTGLDAMPFAGHLSVIHLALQDPVKETEVVNIGIKDSTTLEKGKSVKPLGRVLPEAEKGQQSVEDFTSGEIEEKKIDQDLDVYASGEVPIEDFDLVIMNPPFTRFQKMAGFGENYLDRIKNKRLSNYKDLIDKRMGNHAFFLLVADKIIDEGAEVAAVLSSSILRGYSSRKVRKFYLENYDIKYIIVREDSSNFSEDTDLREILFVAEKGRSEENLTSFVKLKELDSDLHSKIKRARDRTENLTKYESEGFTLRNLEQSELNGRNLFAYVAMKNPELSQIADQIETNEKTSTYEEKGFDIASRDNPAKGGPNFKVFCINSTNREKLQGDYWKVEEKGEGKIRIIGNVDGETDSSLSLDIPQNSLKKAFRRLSGSESMDVSGLEEHIIYAPFEELDQLRHFSDFQKDINWNKWRNYLDDRESHLAVGGRFRISGSGTRNLAFYSEEPRIWSRAATHVIKSPDKSEAKAISLWYNSAFNICQLMRERKETEGTYMEINKFILESTQAIDVEKLSKEEFESIIEKFDQLGKEKNPPLVSQLARNIEKSNVSEEKLDEINNAFSLGDEFGKGFEPRKELDKKFKEILDIEIAIDSLYLNLLYEMAVLKNMM